MPVWRFNRFQLAALEYLAGQRRKAEEAKLMALILAMSGKKDAAMDCAIRASSLADPVLSEGTEEWAERSLKQFSRFQKKFDKIKAGIGGRDGP